MFHSICSIILIALVLCVSVGQAVAAEPQRVLCYGDSITDTGTWVKTVDQHASLVAINAGRSGRRASQAVERQGFRDRPLLSMREFAEEPPNE